MKTICGFTTFYLALVGRARMYIAVTPKRYRAVKDVGKIKMSVGIIAYYHLMLVCQVKIFFLPLIFNSIVGLLYTITLNFLF